MEDKELKIKIEEQIKILKEKISLSESHEETKEEQRILNKLLYEYLKE